MATSRTRADNVGKAGEGVGTGQRFIAPKVHVNSTGWGPTPDNVPTHFADVPYAPFGKNDRIGRSADFAAPAYARNYRGRRDDSQVCVCVCDGSGKSGIMERFGGGRGCTWLSIYLPGENVVVEVVVIFVITVAVLGLMYGHKKEKNQ